MTELERFAFLDEMHKIGNSTMKIKSQTQQIIAYTKEMGVLLDRIWGAGFDKGREKKAAIPKVCLNCQLLGKQLNKN